jgi:hypothetical protein
MKKAIVSVQYLRALAALMLVCHHAIFRVHALRQLLCMIFTNNLNLCQSRKLVFNYKNAGLGFWWPGVG